MSKTLMLAAVLLLSAAWLQAQQTPDNPPAGQSGSQSTSGQMTQAPDASAQTVEGCLSGSSGSYTLTSDSGTTYQLSGDTSKLGEHVGHEIQVKGTTAGGNGAASSSASAGGSMSGSQNTLTVNHVKMVSKTCKSAASNK